ncbi:MAG: hypothetical protein AB1733_12185 [Thermodesulfobacteriota bacterium]
MDYKHIDGLVYSRYAASPPIINSTLAWKYGIQVACPLEPGQYSHFEVGSNVKLKLVVADGTKKMTCHGMIDWVEKDEATGTCMVGFGHLSLTDEEFAVLEQSFADKGREALKFGERLRDKALDAEAVVVNDQAREIMRLKAVNLPVSVIEAVDENRGEATFSGFVTEAIRAYIREKKAQQR